MLRGWILVAQALGVLERTIVRGLCLLTSLSGHPAPPAARQSALSMLAGGCRGVYAAVWFLSLFVQFKAIVCRDVLPEIADHLKYGERWLRRRAGRDHGQEGRQLPEATRDVRHAILATPAQERISQAAAAIRRRREAASAAKRLDRQGRARACDRAMAICRACVQPSGRASSGGTLGALVGRRRRSHGKR